MLDMLKKQDCFARKLTSLLNKVVIRSCLTARAVLHVHTIQDKFTELISEGTIILSAVKCFHRQSSGLEEGINTSLQLLLSGPCPIMVKTGLTFDL